MRTKKKKSACASLSKSVKQICSHCRYVPLTNRFDLPKTLIGWGEWPYLFSWLHILITIPMSTSCVDTVTAYRTGRLVKIGESYQPKGHLHQGKQRKSRNGVDFVHVVVWMEWMKNNCISWIESSEKGATKLNSGFKIYAEKPMEKDLRLLWYPYGWEKIDIFIS